jgi:hypothetical protein
MTLRTEIFTFNDGDGTATSVPFGPYVEVVVIEDPNGNVVCDDITLPWKGAPAMTRAEARQLAADLVSAADQPDRLSPAEIAVAS